MPNKDKALLRILRHLNGTRVEEVADRILALFHAPQRWKPEDRQEVYRVSDCGEIRSYTVLPGEPRSEALCGPLGIVSRPRRTPHTPVRL
jgi:hypothetical protein